MLDASDPAVATAGSSSAILVLGDDRPVLRRRQPGRERDRLLRRHPAGVLPGLAARVHHQPDRHPHRRRPIPTPAARPRDGPRLHADRRGARLPRPASSPQALSNSITQFVASLPDIRGEHRRPSSRRCRPGSTRSAWARSTSSTQALSVLDNLDDFAAPLIVPAPVDRGRQHRGHRDDAHRVLPVDLHGHRPRPDHGLPLPPRAAELRRGGAPAADVRRRARSAASCAARRSWASSTSPSRWSTNLRPRPAAGGAHVGRRPASSWRSRSSGRSSRGRRRSSWRCSSSPTALLPAIDAHGRRLVRRDERAPAADHAGRGRHPPDRRPRLRAHRLEDRRHPRGDLRDPGRGCRVGVLLPLPASVVGRPDRRRPGRQAPRASARGGRSRSPASRRPARRPTSTDAVSDDDRDRRRRPSERAPRARRPGHDAGARPHRAARRRQGARRAAGRRGGPWRPARAAHAARPVPEWTSRPRILVTNDDGVESRGLLALKQALEPMGDVTVVAPDTNQSAVGHQKTLMRPLRVRERTLADGSLGLLGRRLADRRRQPRLPRLLRPRLRPRRVGHQLRREPRRRHHLLGHGQRGDGGGHQHLPGVRDLAGVLRASRLHAGRARARPWSPATS